MTKKDKILPKRLLLILALAFFLISIYLVKLYRSNLVNQKCIDSEVGISLTLPKGWTCHPSEQVGFYIEPPWVETNINSGPAPQFTIWFRNRPDYSGLKVDPRFCNINEYSPESTECPEFVYYSHNGFQINELVSKKNPLDGVSKTYIGVYKDFLEVELHPSSSDFELNNEDKRSFDKIFDSIKRI